MEIGKRVTVIGGRKGKGVTGTVFWVGENRFGDGKRLGVEGDDGETYWLDATHVEASDAPVPRAEGPAPEKGARVRWRQGDQQGLGTVFWYGKSKSGHGGMRVGVNDLDGETRWLDARMVEVLPDDAVPETSPPPDDFAPDDLAPTWVDPGELPPEPPPPEPSYSEWDDEDPPF